jgi:hypothetical protein
MSGICSLVHSIQLSNVLVLECPVLAKINHLDTRLDWYLDPYCILNNNVGSDRHTAKLKTFVNKTKQKRHKIKVGDE